MKHQLISIKKIFSVVVLICAANVLVDQPYTDLLNLRVQYFPGSSYLSESNSKLQVMQYDAAFLLPLVQKNKDVILFGGNYSQLNFHATGQANQKKYLYNTGLAIGYEKHFKNEKWKALLLTLPKINSDKISFADNNFQMGGLLLFNYKKSEKLKYHFGLYYNKECFGDFVMPLLGIEWKPNNKLNIWGDMPANFNVEYKLGKTLYAGASYLSITGSYNISNASEKKYVRDGDKSFGHNQVKAFVNCYLTKNIVWFVEGGRTLGRMYQLYNSKNELQNSDFVYRRNLDGWFANTGIAFRFRTDSE